MGLFSNQFLNVIEWNETRDDVLFWKWRNDEIKKGSRLVIRPGQDAIFLYNGKLEGIFKDEGNYEIETQIIPLLSTLKGFKFGFNSGLRAEVLFVNTKEFLVKWGTKNAVLIPSEKMPGGLPIRCFGTFSVKVDDYMVLIDKIAGIKQIFTVDDVKERVLALLDQLLMKWIVKEGKDIFNLQANAYDISKGIKSDLDMELLKIGLTVTEYVISNFNYPEQIQKMIEKNASYEMVGDLNRYQRIGVIDAMQENPGGAAAGMAQMGAGMAVGMDLARSMMNGMAGNPGTAQPPQPQPPAANTTACTACGKLVGENMNFCGACGTKVVREVKQFCHQCGAQLVPGAKFCSGCGNKLEG